MDSVRGPQQPARPRPDTTSRCSRWPTRRSAASAAPSATTGCFPEAIRQLAANGAEVLVRVSAYMDPWGATEPMNWWTIINRARAIENIAYVVARQPGREPAALSAVLVAGRHPDRRLRRPHARRRVARAWRADRRRADRHLERCGTSASRGAGTTCWRTCGPRRIRSTRSHSTRVRMPDMTYEGNVRRIDAAKKRLR